MKQQLALWLITVGLAISTNNAKTLDDIKKKGYVTCGVSGELEGFSNPNNQGYMEGMDADICRAVATTIFGDKEKNKMIHLNSKERFTALQSGQVDVLTRSASTAFSRDTALGLEFVGVDFFDGQAFVTKNKKITQIKQLNGARVCFETGTTTESNLADYFKSRNLKFTPIGFSDINQVYNGLANGSCDAVTALYTKITSRIAELPQPESYQIIDETISKEFLSIAVRQGDDAWANLVRWSFFALVAAEEFGIDSKNIDTIKTTTNSGEVKRFLGLEDEFGKKLGVNNDWAYQVIKQNGNYAEIFDRNLGQNSRFKLPRGYNKLWKNGGLMYAPPFN